MDGKDPGGADARAIGSGRGGPTRAAGGGPGEGLSAVWVCFRQRIDFSKAACVQPAPQPWAGEKSKSSQFLSVLRPVQYLR